MKLKSLVLAVALVCSSFACGTEFDDGRRGVPTPVPTEYDAGAGDSSTTPLHPSDAGDTEIQVDPGPSTCAAEDPDAGGSSSYCSPCKACNGIESCQDACFGPNCCRLYCNCWGESPAASAAGDGHLTCQLICDHDR